MDGWDDPRMPTLCGRRRRGYTPTSIFTFVREAGISKSDNLIDMRQLEACIPHEGEDGGGGVAAAAQTAQSGHKMCIRDRCWGGCTTKP